MLNIWSYLPTAELSSRLAHCQQHAKLAHTAFMHDPIVLAEQGPVSRSRIHTSTGHVDVDTKDMPEMTV